MASAKDPTGSSTVTVVAPDMPGPMVPVQIPAPPVLSPAPIIEPEVEPEPEVGVAEEEIAEVLEEAAPDVVPDRPETPAPAPPTPTSLPRPVVPLVEPRRFRLPTPGRRPGTLLGLTAVAAAVAALLAAAGGAGAQADRVEDALDRGTAAAGRVSALTAPVEPDEVRVELVAVARAARAAEQARGGAGWATARWSTMSTRIGQLDRRTAGLAQLGGAGPPLGAALVAATGGAPDRTRLEALAATAREYAAAARASGVVAEDRLRPFVQVTALLPDLAAGPGARRWTVCTGAAGPCELLNVTEGRITSRRDLKAGPPALRVQPATTDEESGEVVIPPGDVVLVGPGAEKVAGSEHLVTGALLDALLRAGGSTPAAERVTARTAVPLAGG